MLDPISRHFFENIVTLETRGGRGPLILMYHGTPREKHPSASRFTVTARRFLEQIELLRSRGWTTQCVADLATRENFPDKTVILTFDDGYLDNFENAFLPLRERGLKATWFIPANSIGGEAHWLDSSNPRNALLNRHHLIEMAASGMEIASHSLNHSDLTSLSPHEQLREIADSKTDLENLLGVPITSFAYPFGRYNNESLRLVAAAGYRFACTVRPGWFISETNPHLLRRVTINLSDTLGTFARKLAFADNDASWLSLAKYTVRRFSRTKA